uniref:Uncharacterized protein n=1 Tax=Globodera rostochiensis TaxID=31243 RepID=A0A914I3P8_GLORO
MIELFTMLLLVLSAFEVGQMMDLGKNSVPAVPQQQQAQISQASSSFLSQLATNDRHAFKGENGAPNVGSDHDLILIRRFYVFMIVNLIVPQVPQDMMIRYNNRFVPIEQEYVRCQPLKQTSDHPDGGNQCEFALDKMEVNAQQPNMEIWAKLTDGSGKYRKLGQQTIAHCSPEDSYLFCERTLEIGPDQIDQLPLMSIDAAAFDAIEADHGRHLNALPRYPFGPMPVELVVQNGCNHDIFLGNNPNGGYIVLQPGLVGVTSLANGVQQLWADTDCKQTSCNYENFTSLNSLAMFNVDNNFLHSYAVRYDRGFNMGISIEVPNSNCRKIVFNENMANNLYYEVPKQMRTNNRKSKVQGFCDAFRDLQCCNRQQAGQQVCSPASDWPQDAVDGYRAMYRLISNNQNIYGLNVVNVCHGAKHVHVGFCTNNVNYRN